jgi:hypothetical protein
VTPLRIGFAVWLVLAAVWVVMELRATVPREAIEAHRYADGVLVPRFAAAFNDWAHRHPVDSPGHEGEHYRRVDARDVARWQEVRQGFRALDEALRRAGY